MKARFDEIEVNSLTYGGASNMVTPKICYLQTNGNDSTGEIGNPSKPFLTAQAAFNACMLGSGDHVIFVGVGSFGAVDCSAAGWPSRIKLTGSNRDACVIGAITSLGQAISITGNGGVSVLGVSTEAALVGGGTGTNSGNMTLINLSVNGNISTRGGETLDGGFESGGSGGDLYLLNIVVIGASRVVTADIGAGNDVAATPGTIFARDVVFLGTSGNFGNGIYILSASGSAQSEITRVDMGTGLILSGNIIMATNDSGYLNYCIAANIDAFGMTGSYNAILA